jgi:hypothetical protein
MGFAGKDPERRRLRGNGATFAVLSVATRWPLRGSPVVPARKDASPDGRSQAIAAAYGFQLIIQPGTSGTCPHTGQNAQDFFAGRNNYVARKRQLRRVSIRFQTRLTIG